MAPNRIDTIIDFAAAAKHGVKTEGNFEAANADVLALLRKFRISVSCVEMLAPGRVEKAIERDGSRLGVVVDIAGDPSGTVSQPAGMLAIGLVGLLIDVALRQIEALVRRARGLA